MLSIPLMQGTKGVYLMVRDICCTPSADLGNLVGVQQLYILSHMGKGVKWCAVSILVGRGTTLTIMGINSRTSLKRLSKS